MERYETNQDAASICGENHTRTYKQTKRQRNRQGVER